MNKETGGSAFPVPRHPNGGPVENGMTLRDYFAAKAVQGFTSDISQINRRNGESYASEIADMSYLIAEAMIKRRNK